VNHSADVVIIGGGVIGSSVAFHLKNDGFQGRVLVVERDPSYRFASSALAFGGVRQQFMSRVNVEMARFGAAVYESDRQFGFHQHGYLFLGNADNWERLLNRYEVERSLGSEVELLTVADISKMVPELHCGDLVGGVFGAKDGYIDPKRTVHFLRTSAEEVGVNYLADEIQRIDVSRGTVKAVHAGQARRIETDRLVIAAGAYSRSVAALAGIHLPVTPVRQQLFRCALPRLWSHPFPVVIDPGGVHWRSWGENEIVIAKTKRDERPGIRFELEPERYATEIFPALVHRLPEFRDLQFISGWAGLYEMTPDHNGIIDHHPAVDGLYFACGFSGHGLMMAPAAGKLMSELIRLGRFVSIDASPLSFTRFARNELFWDEAMI
jgi:FAD-dependent oxidoreductase domain-containing protein 1